MHDILNYSTQFNGDDKTRMYDKGKYLAAQKQITYITVIYLYSKHLSRVM